MRVLLGLVMMAVFVASGCGSRTPEEKARDAFVELISSAREANGLPPMPTEEELAEQKRKAEEFAKEMEERNAQMRQLDAQMRQARERALAALDAARNSNR